MSEKTAEDWGRVAVSLPGWRWMPGMRTIHDIIILDVYPESGCETGVFASRGGTVIVAGFEDDDVPDPDDPATAGCLMALLGALGPIMDGLSLAGRMDVWSRLMRALMHDPKDIGRACIAAAAALGRWPGGGE